MNKKLDCKTLWLSDLHLGSRNAKACMATNFLDRTTFETLYLVGDIFDFHVKRRSWHWSKDCEDFVSKVKELADRGIDIFYLPGNHDENLRVLNGGSLYGVKLENELTHVTKDNRRFLVTHGDQFELMAKTESPGDRIGECFYDSLMTLDRLYCFYLRAIKRPHWSLAKSIKLKIPRVTAFFYRFGKVATDKAREQGYDGVICGHTHNPIIKRYGNTVYCNTGDWVESCSALIEDHNGQLQLINANGLPLMANDIASSNTPSEAMA